MNPEQDKKPPRCNCCKKTATAKMMLHTYDEKVWCGNCLYGHDDDEFAKHTHLLRRFCSCCISPAHGGFYNLQPVTGMCAICSDRPTMCKPGGPHRSSTRGEGSPPIHQHSCHACRRWFFCDCGEGVQLMEQVYCGCNGRPHPLASGPFVHQHTCSRCQDQTFRCIVDDNGARPACINCRSDVTGFVARGTQEKSIKKGQKRACMKLPKRKTRPQGGPQALDLEMARRAMNQIRLAQAVEPAPAANNFANWIANLEPPGNF